MGRSKELPIEAVELYYKGLSCKEIAQLFSLCSLTVVRKLRKVGVRVYLRCQRQEKEKNHNWQGGQTMYSINRLTHRIIIEEGRSLFICEKCNVKAVKTQWPPTHNVHHIDYNRSNNDPLNLQVLCVPCHSRIHAEDRRDANTGRFLPCPKF